MLEHLGRDDPVELAVGERQLEGVALLDVGLGAVGDLAGLLHGTEQLEDAGLEYVGRDHAHGLHAPYWWLKCAVGVDNDRNPLVRAYHQVLVWDIMRTPRWSTLTRAAERVLNPLIGKSMVLYLHKPGTTAP